MFDWDNMKIKKRSPDDWHAKPFEKPQITNHLLGRPKPVESVLGVPVKKKYTKNER